MDNEAKKKVENLKLKIRLAETVGQLAQLELMVASGMELEHALHSAYNLGFKHASDKKLETMTAEDRAAVHGAPSSTKFGGGQALNFESTVVARTTKPPEPLAPSTLVLRDALRRVMGEAAPSKVKISTWSPARKREAMKWAEAAHAWGLGDYTDPGIPTELNGTPIMPTFLKATGKKRPAKKGK